MAEQKIKRYVLSLGGALIVPTKGIDVKFLRKFEEFIRKKTAQKCRFFIVTGGGHTCRHYQQAAAAIAGNKIDNLDLDWLGVHSTRLNGHFIRTIFRDITYPRLIKHYDLIDKRALEYKVVVGVGWKPGWSSDYDSVLLAQDYGIKVVINLTSVDMVYNKDPNKYKNAKPIKIIKWDEMLKITGNKWSPGLNTPFDPMAAKLAKKLGLKVIVCNGKNLLNLNNIIEGKKFVGTVIE